MSSEVPVPSSTLQTALELAQAATEGTRQAVQQSRDLIRTLERDVQQTAAEAPTMNDL